MLLPALGLIFGMVIGFLLPVEMGAPYFPYLTIGIIICLEAVTDGVKDILENVFIRRSFILNFLCNVCLAVVITYTGQKLNSLFYLTGVLCFSLQLFKNILFIRNKRLHQR